MIVDHQAHWHPRAYLEWLRRRDGHPLVTREGDGFHLETAGGDTYRFGPAHVELELQLADMDANGIDVMVSSPSIIGEFADLGGADLAEAAERLNQATADAQREHPDRFVGLAVLPLQDPELALSSLDRAIGDLGLRGVCVPSNVDGASLSRDELLPVFGRIAELGVPLFLHPAGRSLLRDQTRSAIVERGLNWMCDTTVAALSLIYDGVLDAHPSLTVVHPHLGGVLPFVAGRLMASPRVLEVAPRPLSDYLERHFYTDTASDTPAAFGAAATLYRADRILLATDYPWKPRAGMRALLAEQDGRTLDRDVVLANRVPGLVPVSSPPRPPRR
jgi:predicted TIM-barrel fold metal-dependent hydrolase